MNSTGIASKAIRGLVNPKNPIKSLDMTHHCIGSGCRYVGCENQIEQPKRQAAK